MNNRRAECQLGLGLLELLITLGLFSVVGLLSYSFLTYGVRMGQRVESASDVAGILRKAQFPLQSDLLLAHRGEVVILSVPDQVGGGGFTSEALAFRSAIDPETGVFCQKPDGTPLWQKTILYYLAVPSQHDSLFGQSCAGGAEGTGFDDRCPHKFLIRKVIDNPPATTPTSSPEAEEPLPTDLSSYLTQPTTFDLGSMSGEPGLIEARLVAQPLLWFQVATDPSGSLPGEVEIDLRALMISDARRKLNVGSVSLLNDPLVLQHLFTVLPLN